MHPGSFTTGTRAGGAAADRATRLRALLASAAARAAPMILLEHTAGQGTNLGHRFEHLAAILERAGRIAAGRRLPRHLSPARRPATTSAPKRDTTRRSASSIGSSGSIGIEVVSLERLEEAVRQPRRSARAHRQGLPRSRAVPAPAERSALRAACRCCSRRRSSIRPRAGAGATSIRGTRATCGRCGG